MNLRVIPDLAKVVDAAQEANVIIQEVHFVRSTEDDELDGLMIRIDGKEHALGYFTYLLENQNLHCPVA